MDRNRFDALARALASKRSRRGALAMLLSSGFLRHSPQTLAARGGKGHKKQCTPGADPNQCGKLHYPVLDRAGVVAGYEAESCCKNGFCSCGGQCCGNGCFQTGDERLPTKVFCCSDPQFVECPDASGEGETCCEGSCENCPQVGPGAVTGSYRRR